MDDLVWRTDHWELHIDKVARYDYQLRNSITSNAGNQELLLNIYRVMLTRAKRGLGIWFKDEETKRHFKEIRIMGGMWNYIQNEGGNVFIENCHVTGKIIVEGCAGGVVGSVSTVKNCSFTGTVEGSKAGGIAGEAYYVYGCTAHADVVGFYDVGGISGEDCCVRDRGLWQGDV